MLSPTGVGDSSQTGFPTEPAQLLDPQGLEEDFSSKQVLTLGSEQRLRLHPGREAGWAWDTHLMVYAEAGEGIPVSGVQVTKNTLTHRLPGTRVICSYSCPGWVEVYLL